MEGGSSGNGLFVYPLNNFVGERRRRRTHLHAISTAIDPCRRLPNAFGDLTLRLRAGHKREQCLPAASTK